VLVAEIAQDRIGLEDSDRAIEQRRNLVIRVDSQIGQRYLLTLVELQGHEGGQGGEGGESGAAEVGINSACRGLMIGCLPQRPVCDRSAALSPSPEATSARRTAFPIARLQPLRFGIARGAFAAGVRQEPDSGRSVLESASRRDSPCQTAWDCKCDSEMRSSTSDFLDNRVERD